MKLRVRSAVGGPTYKINVPLPETLQNLKEAVSTTTSVPLASLTLSLNKKDPIEGPGTTLLSALAVRGGDLLFFSTRSPDAMDSPASMRALCGAAADLRASASRKPVVEISAVVIAATSEEKAKPDEAGDMNLEVRGSPLQEGNEEVVQDGEDGPMALRTGDEKAYASIPALLHRVLVMESDNITERPAYLVLAAHAVMLETGFVRVESSNRASSSSVQTPLLSSWSRSGGIVNVEYSLPELLDVRAANSTTKSVGDVLLRCQIVGSAFIAYGTVAGGGGSQVYRLILPLSKFVCQPSKSCCSAEEVKPADKPTEGDQTVDRDTRDLTSSIFTNVFELWKEVKDRLSLPLLTDLCEKAGLPPPPSLLLLPTELKVKILESLPAATLAAVACVCTGLKFLASSDELWKIKFHSEFPTDRAPGGRGWKVAFGELVRRRRRQESRRIAGRHFCVEPFPTLVLRPSVGSTFGGDYDRFPFPAGPAFPGRLGPTSGARYRRGIFPAPAVGINRGGALGTRLGGDIWGDLGRFGMRGDELGGDHLERF